MRVRLALTVVVALAVIGCAEHTGIKDPRKGRVITHSENCFVGSCESDWKVCIGPDLLFHFGEADHEEYTVKNAPECER